MDVMLLLQVLEPQQFKLLLQPTDLGSRVHAIIVCIQQHKVCQACNAPEYAYFATYQTKRYCR